MRRSDLAITEDGILGNRIRLRQPAEGYRAAIDPVLLAAAVEAAEGDTVLDVGTGTGAAALCLAERAPGFGIAAIEIQPELAALAHENAALNGFEDRITVRQGDVMDCKYIFPTEPFDQVMTNPPYFEPGESTPPPDPSRRLAHVHDSAGLADWIGACLSLLRPGGIFTIIHRAERLGALLGAIEPVAGEANIFPLWPGSVKPARRVIVRARKGIRAPSVLHPGLVLHGPSGGYTEEAEQVLRHAQPLVF
jgi:tRNA1(Val) A37 N6-methylase TrmN6